MKAKAKFIAKASGQQISHVIKSGYEIYPVNLLGKWFIEVKHRGEVNRFKKAITAAEIPEAIDNTVIFYYNKLKGKK